MIYGLHSKLYSGLLAEPLYQKRVLCECIFDEGSGDIKLEFSTNNGLDWQAVVDTSVGLDLTGEELFIPAGQEGSDPLFRLEIDIDPTIPDMDDFGNSVWGYHPKGRVGTQVNFYRWVNDERETWTHTGNDGVWSAILPPGNYYYFYDHQTDLDKKTLPPEQYIIVGAGDISDSFGEDIQFKFKRSEEVYLATTFTTTSWARYMITEMGVLSEANKRDMSQYSSNIKVRDGRLFKGDAYVDFIGLIFGKA